MDESTVEPLARIRADAREDVESKKSGRALQESEERYRVLFEQCPIGISITTLDGNIIHANKTMHAILGYSTKELKNINAADLYEKSEERNALVDAIKRHGALSDFSVRLKRKDGTSFDALMNVSQVHIGGKSLLQTTLQDITERKKTEEMIRESEERYRNLFENARDVIYTHDLKGKICAANRATEEYGFQRDQLIGKNMLKFVPKKYWPKLIKQLSDITRGNPIEGEIEVITPTGKRSAEYRSNPIRAGGKVIGAQTVMRDITERKKVEEAIRESEEKFKSIFEDIADGVVYLDRFGKILEINRKAVDIFGGSREELLGRRFTEIGIFSFKDTLVLMGNLVRILRGKKAVLNVEIKNKKGQVISLECSTSLLKISDRTMIAAVLRDVSQRKKAEEAIRVSKERWERTFDSMTDLIAIIDADFRIVQVNRSMAHRLGMTPEGCIGLYCYECVHKLNKPLSICPHSLTLADGKEHWVEIHEENLKGDFLVSTTPLLDQQGHIIGSVHVARDITERKKMEEALRQSEDKFKSLFERSPEAMAHVDSKFEVLDLNSRFTELFGYTREEAKGRNLDSLIVPADMKEEAEKLDKRAVEGYVYHDTIRKTKHGSLVPVSVSAAPIAPQGVIAGYVAVYKDISHLKKTEEALTIMNEKLRVISGLTRHDARNRLFLATTNAYLAKERLAGNNEAKDYLEKIEAAVNDVVDIFDFARAYEMLGVEKPTYVDVEKAVKEAVSLFAALNTVRVTIDCHGLAVLADSLLRQAFYNLIDDSLKHAQNLTQIKVYFEREDNEHLKLIYEDNGVGIPLDSKPRLFQKGYTTGKGSGYGLYLIQKMMEIYGWTIQETGEPGKGAKFVMRIPKLNKEGKELYHLNKKT